VGMLEIEIEPEIEKRANNTSISYSKEEAFNH
jgi:hypothetical protein